MLNTNFSPWPSFTEEESDAVRRVLLSNRVNYWTGNETRAFEKEFAHWVGTEYAIALANGTIALELALLALGIRAGDEVIVTSRTFIASVSSIILVGATPIFADVELDSQNISAATIQPVLTSKTKAIICVHLAGWPCDMDDIMDIANQHGVFVIEDCAQAHGGLYKGRSVGSIGHIAAWSFCQDKIMTTGGEGGMVTTNNRDWWSFMWSYKDHGKSLDAIDNRADKSGFRWLHESFGTNGRLTEIQAAIGRIQLQRMEKWHNQRKINANKIWKATASLRGVRVPRIPEYVTHAAYKCYIFLESNKSKWSRDQILNQINYYGVPCYTGSCSEVYLEKTFDRTPFRPQQRLPNAKQLGETSLMFLVHPTLSEDEINKTCCVIRDVLSEAGLNDN